MKTVILKISGKVIDSILTDPLWLDFFELVKESKIKLIMVHGAGIQISEWSSRLGLKSEFSKEGFRITSPAMMEVVTGVQVGLVNSQLTAFLNAKGFQSVGLSGISFSSFRVKNIEKELGAVGLSEATSELSHVRDILDKDIIPVFSTVCSSETGDLINVNADNFTESLSLGLKNSEVYFVSDVEGVYVNGMLQSDLSVSEIEKFKSSFSEGMIPKLKSAIGICHESSNKAFIVGSDPMKLMGAVKKISHYGTEIREVVYVK